ncbi:MAG TPA: DUF4191 domain-containing protein [Kineosporiaceae bacterium]|nr:DUF4191 domain-containing protein [Kineosporiaceae bacterium]
MARSKSGSDSTPAKQGRIAQLRAVFTMTRRADPAVVWWMLLGLLAPIAVGFLIGALVGQRVYVTILGALFGIMLATMVMARRAERAAFAQLAGQPGAALAALQNVKRGWDIEDQPCAVDPRTQDLVFRAVGRPGVLLVTEGPLPRVARLAEQERKRVNKLLGSEVPVTVLHTGDDEGQLPLRKLRGAVLRLRPKLTKTEVSAISKRLRAFGAVKPPIPKGIDPMRMRPDRRATRGR